MSAPAWVPCTEDDPGPGIAREHWGLTVLDAERLDRESMNGVWRFRTDDGRFVLKRLGLPASARWLDFQLAATEAAARAEIPAARTIPSIRGIHTESTTIGQCQLRRYRDGRSFTAGSTADITQAAQMLRSLHRVPVAGLAQVPCPSANLESWLAPAENALQDLEKVLAEVVPADLADRALHDYGSALDRATHRLGAVGYATWPVVLTHGEISGSNLVFDAEGMLAAVLDWDAIQLRPRVYDLALAALFLGRTKRGSLNNDPAVARFFLDQATIGNPLSGKEIDALSAVLELYFVPTADRLARYAHGASKDVERYVGWSAEGARRSRELLAAIIG
ncbi:aminoglycoside phosphotransferase family protein [Nocardia sp. NPDC052566]|uniref:aminoglycoside phosphotransferase family protein n=1 Tax=Nocardia sp. NPDC052566 TaxID=3364330 RepID=UPI0037CA4CB6